MSDAPLDIPRAKGRAVFKDMIPLRAYAIPESIPEKVRFSAHPIKFLGYKPFAAAPDLVWGVHGTASLNSADAFASRDAQHLKRRLYQIELLYRLDGIPPAGTSVTEAFAQSAGYLHMSRITSAYRDKLKTRMIGWLQAEEDPELEELSDLPFEEMLKSRPMFVHALMTEDQHLKAVIHPVKLAGGVSLRIATVRNLKSHIVRVYTRFHEEIETVV